MEVLERRINCRRQCKLCDAVTSTFVHKEPTCPEPNCDGLLYARNDDAIDSFRRRYVQYQEFTAPLFEYYRAQGILVEIDGSQAPDMVFEAVKRVIDDELVTAG